MIPFQPFGTAKARPISLAQRVRPLHTPVKTLGETFDEMLGFSPLLGDLLRLAGHGLGTWVGVYAGIYGRSPWMKAVGWTIGIGQGLTGICDVVSIVQRLIRPLPMPQLPAAPGKSTEEIQMTGKKWKLVT